MLLANSFAIDIRWRLLRLELPAIGTQREIGIYGTKCYEKLENYS